MINPITGALIGGGINLLGGLVGGLFAGEDRQRVDDALQEAEKIIDEVGAPPETARAIILDQFRVAGLESPQLEQAVDVGVSEMGKYQEDPRFREAGISALEKMKQQSEAGLTAEDRLAFRQLQQEQERASQSKIQQIRQEAQMRGMGGSGSELASSLLGAQSGSERGLSAAMQVGAQSQQARQAALQQFAGQAQSMRGADLATAESVLSAKDKFKELSARGAMERQARNIAAQNLAQQRNLQTQQRVGEMNVAQGNEESRRQREAEGTDWTRGFAYGQARTQPRMQRALQYQKGAEATQQSWGDMAKSTSDIFGSVLGYKKPKNTA